LVKNNFPKSLFSVVKPFVLSLSKHERLDGDALRREAISGWTTD